MTSIEGVLKLTPTDFFEWGSDRGLSTIPSLTQLDAMATSLGYDRRRKLICRYLVAAPADPLDMRAMVALTNGIFDTPCSRQEIDGILLEVRDHCLSLLGWDPLGAGRT